MSDICHQRNRKFCGFCIHVEDIPPGSRIVFLKFRLLSSNDSTVDQLENREQRSESDQINKVSDRSRIEFIGTYVSHDLRETGVVRSA